jgi:hypothetical protein
MALRWMDGFDLLAGTNADWLRRYTNSSVGPTYVTGRYNGNAIYGNGTWNKTLLGTAQASWVAGFAFQLRATPGTNQVFYLQDAGTKQCGIEITAAPKLTFCRNGTVLTGGSGTVVLSQTIWYYVEFKATISDSISASTCKIRINGTDDSTVSAAQDSKNTSNASADGFFFQANGNAHVFDDFYLLDSTGSTNNDFLGDSQVLTVFPDGNGASSSFVGSDGNSVNNYLLVDESTPNDDTDYVESGTVGERDTYTFADINSAYTTIYGLQTNFMARKSAVGFRSMAPSLYDGSTYNDGTSAQVFDTYLQITNQYDQNPFTTSAWTPTTVNSMQYGFKITV